MKKTFLLAVLSTLIVSCGDTNKLKNENMEKKNTVVETIMSRRSIRSYKPEQISQAQLDTIIECAINAPSALNKQSWVVRVVQDTALLNAINNSFVEKAKGKKLEGSAARAQELGFSVYHGSPTLIIVAKDKSNDYSAID